MSAYATAIYEQKRNPHFLADEVLRQHTRAETLNAAIQFTLGGPFDSEHDAMAWLADWNLGEPAAMAQLEAWTKKGPASI